MLIFNYSSYYHANLQLQKEVRFCQVWADFSHTLSSDQLLFAAQLTAKTPTVRKQIHKWAQMVFPASLLRKIQR